MTLPGGLDNPADALELDDDPETVAVGWAGTFIAVEINLCGRTRNEKMGGVENERRDASYFKETGSNAVPDAGRQWLGEV